MSDTISFRFEALPVRVVLREDCPWFVATDVCEALGIANSRDAVGRLDEDEKGVGSADTLGGAQRVQLISEAGLYSLVVTSRRPEARTFKRWVTHEVLPSIRRTGGYGVAPLDFSDPKIVAGVLSAQLAKVAELEADLASKSEALALAAPKARAFEDFAEADGLFTLQNAGRATGVGANRFIEILKQRGILFYQDGALVAKAHLSEHGSKLFLHRGTKYTHPKTQKKTTSTQTYVTAKGVAHFTIALRGEPGAAQQALGGMADA